MPDFNIDTSIPVMITGTTGYVAGWIVKNLLEAGATVHAPVRDPDNSGKLAHLTAIAGASPGTLKFFKADLLDEGSYAQAMQGCGIVFHTASPFTLNVNDPQKQLIDPALKGTQNVLAEANRQQSVTRVVLTSSCAAIHGDNIDSLNVPDKTLTEEHWNQTSSLDHIPYSYSKTLAEREAWTIAEAQSRWKLVAINPAFVLGPALNNQPTSESFALIRQFGDGTFRFGAPQLEFGTVDVRDLARAHLAAAYISDARGRHIISGRTASLMELVDCLRDEYGQAYPLPKMVTPKWLMWLVGPFMANVTRKYLARNINHPLRFDNSKSVRDLGMTYRPLNDTMVEMFKSAIDRGILAQR